MRKYLIGEGLKLFYILVQKIHVLQTLHLLLAKGRTIML